MSDYLQEELEPFNVAILKDGETAYTLPWAVHKVEGGLFWIRGDYDVYLLPQGYAKLKIRREGEEIVADENTVGDYPYPIREKPMDAWDPIPIRWE